MGIGLGRVGFVVAVVVVAWVDFIRVEVRVESVVRPVRISRTGPQVAPAALAAEALPPVTSKNTFKGTAMLPFGNIWFTTPGTIA